LFEICFKLQAREWLREQNILEWGSSKWQLIQDIYDSWMNCSNEAAEIGLGSRHLGKTT